MKNKINYLIIGILLIGMIGMVSSLEVLKPAKLNRDYTILQTCASCSYVNITISNKNGILENNVEMVNDGSGVWTYNMTPVIVGRHDVTGMGDLQGTDTSFATYFPVTSSGLLGTLGFYFLILILSVGTILIGFKIEDNWVIVLGGFGLTFVGLFTLFNGIDGIKDPVYTWGLGIIVLMLGAYFSIRAGLEAIGDRD